VFCLLLQRFVSVSFLRFVSFVRGSLFWGFGVCVVFMRYVSVVIVAPKLVLRDGGGVFRAGLVGLRGVQREVFVWVCGSLWLWV